MTFSHFLCGASSAVRLLSPASQLEPWSMTKYPRSPIPWPDVSLLAATNIKPVSWWPLRGPVRGCLASHWTKSGLPPREVRKIPYVMAEVELPCLKLGVHSGSGLRKIRARCVFRGACFVPPDDTQPVGFAAFVHARLAAAAITLRQAVI